MTSSDAFGQPRIYEHVQYIKLNRYLEFETNNYMQNKILLHNVTILSK